jgi:preprotein translocase subunit SecG
MDFKELANPELFKPQIPSSNIRLNHQTGMYNSVYNNIQTKNSLDVLYSGGNRKSNNFFSENMLNIIVFIVLISLIIIFLGYKYYNKQKKDKEHKELIKKITAKHKMKRQVIKKRQKVKKIKQKNKKISNKRNVRINNKFLL